jgi:hypothetical protein
MYQLPKLRAKPPLVGLISLPPTLKLFGISSSPSRRRSAVRIEDHVAVVV